MSHTLVTCPITRVVYEPGVPAFEVAYEDLLDEPISDQPYPWEDMRWRVEGMCLLDAEAEKDNTFIVLKHGTPYARFTPKRVEPFYEVEILA